VLREGFDVELASNGWTIDLQQELGDTESHTNGLETQSNGEDPGYGHIAPEGSAVDLYEAAVPDPTMDALHRAGRMTLSNRLEIETTETQVFLGQQLKVLESYRLKHEAMLREEARSRNGKPSHEDYYNGLNPEPKVLEHIGPVQFNMGGIQVDADDMVQRLKERQTYDSSPPSPEDRDDGPQMDTENLQAFFQGLMARRGGPGN
jgi:dynein light intermediate chain 1